MCRFRYQGRHVYFRGLTPLSLAFDLTPVGCASHKEGKDVIWRSIILFSVVLTTCLLLQRDTLAGPATTSSGPQAHSDLLVMDFEFSLTEDQSVQVGPPVVWGDELRIGNADGDFSEAGVEGDFPLGEVFGPNPWSLDGNFHFQIFGGVSAFADPPSVSLAWFIQEVTGFLTFRNYAEGEGEETIPLSYQGTYSLLALGDTSSAGIDLEARMTPVDGDSSDTPLISDFITNDDMRDERVPAEGEGTLPIEVAFATIIYDIVIPGETELRLELTSRAQAEVVPEPCSMVLVCSGLLGLIGLRRSRASKGCGVSS